jgi:peptidoglycan/xylan/chitin deacetylase (PgdA/CDA1 family)
VKWNQQLKPYQKVVLSFRSTSFTGKLYTMEDLASVLENCRNHLRSGLYLDAIGHINEHLFNNQYSSQAWSMLGVLWFEVRKFSFAADAFERAEKIESLNVANKIKYTICKVILNDHFADHRILREMRLAITSNSTARFIPPKLEDSFSSTHPLPVLFQANCSESVFITIDDGPNTNSTHLILSALRSDPSIRVNFFVSGKSLDQIANVDVLRAIVNDGHSLYSHGFSHTPFTLLDKQTIVDELSRTENILSQIRPTPDPYYIRLPGGMGWNSEAVHDAVRSWNEDAVLVHWTIDPQDYYADRSMQFSKDPILEAKVRALEAFFDPCFVSGGILLTHDKVYGNGVVNEVFLSNYFNFLIEFCRVSSINAKLIDKIFFEDRFVNKQNTIANSIVVLSQTNTKLEINSKLELEKLVPKIVKIDTDNFSHFCDTKYKNIPISLVKKIKDRNWISINYPFAYLLMIEDRCVGCLLAIYSDRIFNGESHIVCNLSTWYVEEDYRFASTSLLTSALQDAKDVTVTILTPSHSVERIYKSPIMNFNVLDSKRVALEIKASFNSNVNLINFESNKNSNNQFTPNEISLLQANCADEIHGFILTSPSARCFFIVRGRSREDKKVWDVLYLKGDESLLRTSWKDNTQLISTGDLLLIDRRFLSDEIDDSYMNPPTARYVRFPINKPEGFNIDFLYSEIVIFNSSLL